MRSLVDRITDTPTHPSVSGVFGWRRNTLPRTNLLLYLARPNSDEYLIGESTVIGEDTYIWGYHTGADETIRAATGWLPGMTTNPFYDSAGDPVVVLASEILAWPNINAENTLFKSVNPDQQTGKLAIYALGTDAAILEKAKKVLGLDSSYDELIDGSGNVLTDSSTNILTTAV